MSSSRSQHLAVDAHALESGFADVVEHLLVMPLAPLDHRGEDLRARAVGQRLDRIDDLLRALRDDFLAADRAVGHADARVEQAQVVVNLGDGADGRARVVADALLVDRDRRDSALRSDRRRVFPSVRGTGGHRRSGSRRSAAALRRRSCRTPATTCPIPTSPVMTTSRLRGISTSIFLRLCSRAPRTTILSCAMILGSDFVGELYMRSIILSDVGSATYELYH